MLEINAKDEDSINSSSFGIVIITCMVGLCFLTFEPPDLVLRPNKMNIVLIGSENREI